MIKTWAGGLLVCVLIFSTACNSTSAPDLPALSPSPSLSTSPQPGVVKSLPTPAATGKVIVYNDLQVVMSQAEITTSYLNEYGSTREPSAGMEFLWIHINLKNTGSSEQVLPAPEHFSVLNGTIEFKPIYGHRKDYADYLALSANLVQGQAVDAWLRFDVPAGLELTELSFAYMPESMQISVGFSPTVFFWGDQPIYIWSCAP